MRILKIMFSMATILCLMSCSKNNENGWTVTSPDGKVTATVMLTPVTADVQQQNLSYQITYAGVTVIENSPLGLYREDQQFAEDLQFNGTRKVTQIDETYTLVHGKRKTCRNHAQELTLGFLSEKGSPIEIVFRAYDDGVAFKYRFPGQDDQKKTVTSELTGFKLPQNGRAFMEPYDLPTQWTPAYEAYFKKDLAIGTNSLLETGWCFPALFEVNQHWVLITEAGMDGSYHGSRLEQQAPDGLYRIRGPQPEDGNNVGAVNPSHTLPWETPWRVIVTGNSLKPIVETSLVTHLSQANQIEQTDWIKPGRVSWSWWSEQDSPRKPDRLKAFIDLAAEMGWEYSLIDANWNYMLMEEIEDIAQYAREKSVGLLFWYNSGGPHNIVTEAPRDRMMTPESREKEFTWLKSIGAKGVKVDFFHSDKQMHIQHYLNIIKDAAKHEIMVNFHGCTLPRGWTRTFPNVMSMEAVRGAECYIFDDRYPEMAPSHNVILAFTRNVVGPMDYTPVTFSDNNNAHLTTYGHELALSVIFESGWLHCADRISAYQNLPEAPKEFLKKVPVAWDETRFIAGEPGRFVVLARQKGDKWYVAGINGENTPRTVTLDLSFLTEKTWSAKIIADGNDAKSFETSIQTVKAGEPMEIQMLAYGGFVVELK